MVSFDLLLGIFWIFLLLLISRFVRINLIKQLMILSYLLFTSTKPAKVLYALLFFSGVVVHELSHMFVAMFLGVRTGDISLFPEETNQGLKLGWVKMAKTDPLRSALIGAAPFFVGWLLIYLAIRIQFPLLLSIQSQGITQTLDAVTRPLGLILFFLIFAISNTMVLSESDQRGFIPAGIIVLCVLLLISLFPFPEIDSSFIQENISNSVEAMLFTITIVIALNSVVVLTLVCITKIITVFSGKRVYFERNK